jgi:glucose-1-phosphate thymidylyltransferase
VISTPRDVPTFKAILGDGSQWGIQISYATQENPNGIAEAFIIGEHFLNGESVALILGDNIFYGHNLQTMLHKAAAKKIGASIFGYQVADPERYGVVDFDEQDKVISLEEKPTNPRSNWAITGLYFYDNRAPEIAANLTPSARGELEITDLNRVYLEAGELHLERFGRGFAWLDTGTAESLLEASEFVRTIATRQGLKVSCPEEIAFRLGLIDEKQLSRLAEALGASPYGTYLRNIIE